MTIDGKIYKAGTDALVSDLVKISLTDNTGAVVQNITTNDGTFFVDVNDDSALTWIVKLSANGYKDTTYSLAQIDSNGNIFMTPGSSGVKLIVGAAIVVLLFTQLQKKKKKVGELKFSEVQPFIMIATVIVGAIIVNKLLIKLGIFKGKGQVALDNENNDPNSPFKPSFWKTGGVSALILPNNIADNFASTIHGSFTLFQDDFNSVWSVFSQLRTQSEVSYLADIFQQKYNEDLLNFLTDGGGILPWDGLNDDHLNTIISFVRTLPQYTA